MNKTIEQYFRDWEGDTFGFGYGSGEPHIIPVLKHFLSLCKNGPCQHQYDYAELEKELTPPTAWLLINILCHEDMIEYGASPRFGWLTKKGELLKEFITSKTADELIDIACDQEEHYDRCYKNVCNCPEDGFVEGEVCFNPFWRS